MAGYSRGELRPIGGTSACTLSLSLVLQYAAHNDAQLQFKPRGMHVCRGERAPLCTCEVRRAPASRAGLMESNIAPALTKSSVPFVLCSSGRVRACRMASKAGLLSGVAISRPVLAIAPSFQRDRIANTKKHCKNTTRSSGCHPKRRWLCSVRKALALQRAQGVSASVSALPRNRNWNTHHNNWTFTSVVPMQSAQVSRCHARFCMLSQHRVALTPRPVARYSAPKTRGLTARS